MLSLLLTVMVQDYYEIKILEKFEGKKIYIRLSVDGWGKADEFTRPETVWEENSAVMDQIL